MKYEEFLQLSKEEQLKILNEYAQYNFNEGKEEAWSEETHRGMGGCWCEFVPWIETAYNKNK